MQINGLGPIQGPQSIQGPQRPQFARQPAAPRQNTGVDQLDISPEAQILSQVRDIPEIRADRVAEIRAAIDAGAYETEDKLDVALDRLLDEIG